MRLPRPIRAADRGLLALLATYLGLALAYWLVVPIWEAPDAIWHYEFASHLASGKGLPTEADAGLEAPWRQQGSQPPLYYLLMGRLIAPIDRSDAAEVIRFNPHAAVGVPEAGGNVNRMVHGSWERWPWTGTVLAARLMGLAGILLFGLGAVLATWAGIRALFPEQPAVALAGTAIFALSPELLFFSGAISNDIAIIAAGALVLWRAAVVLNEGATRRGAFWLGVAGGLAMLSKLSGLWLLPPAGLALLYAIWRDSGAIPARGGSAAAPAGHGSDAPASAILPDAPRPPGRLRRFLVSAWQPVSIFGAALVLVAGWWYLRNWLRFGDPTGLPLMLSVMAPRPAPPGPRELGILLLSVWRSYWAVFGWLTVRAPDGVFTIFDLLTLGGLAGLALAWARGRFGALQHAGLALAGSFVGLMLVALVAWAQLRYPQGRLALPVAPALATLIGAGWVRALPESRSASGARGLALALALLAAWLLVAVIDPAYRPEAPQPRPDPALDATIRPRAIADFGPGLALHGAVVRIDDRVAMTSADGLDAGHLATRHEDLVLRSGAELRVDLAWAAGRSSPADRSIFLHLLDAQGRILAQRDSYPQSGRLATSDWGRGPSALQTAPDRFYIPDRHPLVLPPTHASTCDCRLVLGVYDATTGQRIPAADGADAVDLGRVRVEPSRGPDGLPNPMAIPFGERIELAGLDLPARAATPGETALLTLHWRALATPRGDYKVSVQVHDADGAILAQHDERPAEGARHTETWRRGELVADRHPLAIAAETPPGDYRLRVLVYEDETLAKLPVRWRDFELDLGPFTVLEP